MLQVEIFQDDFNNERRDKERALSEKESLMKQTATLLNDLKALQQRVSAAVIHSPSLYTAQYHLYTVSQHVRRTPS